jgi:hypothetical protein
MSSDKHARDELTPAFAKRGRKRCAADLSFLNRMKHSAAMHGNPTSHMRA